MSKKASSRTTKKTRGAEHYYEMVANRRLGDLRSLRARSKFARGALLIQEAVQYRKEEGARKAWEGSRDLGPGEWTLPPLKVTFLGGQMDVHEITYFRVEWNENGEPIGFHLDLGPHIETLAKSL